MKALTEVGAFLMEENMELTSFINKVATIMEAYKCKSPEVSEIYNKFLKQAEQLKNNFI